MAEKIRYEVDVDSSDAKRGLQDFSRAAKAAGKDAAKSLDDTASAGDKARAAIKAMAESMQTELRASAKAADALGKALGPELTGQVDVDRIIADLTKMGVSFDEITADADKFAATIREVDSLRADVKVDADVDGAIGKLHRAGDELDNTGRRGKASAETFQSGIGPLRGFTDELGASSVAAGTWSNAIIDAGEAIQVFGGAAGFSEESLGKISLALGGVGIAAGLLIPILGKMFSGASKDAKALDAAAQKFTESLTGTVGAADNLNTALDAAFDVGGASEAAIVARAFLDALDPAKVQDFRHALSDLSMTNEQFIAELQLAGGTFDQFIRRQVFATGATDEVINNVASLVENFDGYTTILGSADGATADFIRNNQSLVTGLDEMGTALGGLNLEAYARNFLQAQRGTASETKAIDDAIAATNTYTDALQEYLQWKQRQNSLQTQALAGLEAEKVMWDSIATATKAATDADKARHDQLMADVAAKVLDDEKTMWESIATATEDATAAQVEHTAAVQDAAIAIANIVDDLPDVAAALSTEFGKVNDVVSGLKFDVDFQPALGKALDDLHSFDPDFQTLADNWSTILAGKPVDIFGNVRADDAEFLDKVAGLSDLFQKGVVNAFDQGGVDAANTFVQSTAATIAASTGLDIGEVYRIMGLGPDGSVTTLIKPEIEKDHADKAKAILDALTSVAPGDERIAAIQIALETGNIDGDLAYAQSLLLAQTLGVPVTLTTPNLNDTQHDIDTATKDRTTQVIVPKSDSLGQMQTLIDHVAQPRTVVFISTADNAGQIDRILDAVADDRVATFFSVVNEGSRRNADATLDNVARDRTAHITTVTSGGGGGGGGTPGGQAAPAGLAATPTTAATPTPSAVTMTPAPAAGFTANLTINTGVLGNHFDVERTITRAMRRASRINGRRAVTP